MFLAVFIPPMKKSSAVRVVVIAAAVCSCVFSIVPVLQNISSGFVIIICSVFAATIGALIKPVETDENE